MTKKDYITIAACVKAEWETRAFDLGKGSKERAIYSLHSRIANACKAENPNFDRNKFEKACGF